MYDATDRLAVFSSCTTASGSAIPLRSVTAPATVRSPDCGATGRQPRISNVQSRMVVLDKNELRRHRLKPVLLGLFPSGAGIVFPHGFPRTSVFAPRSF